MYLSNKKKLFNDPLYGLIALHYDALLDVIDSPYFQRLRRISQLGLTQLVYPGAIHSRFHHSLGALFLMQDALEVLKGKGVEITDEEAQGACLAILLHDVGHGPFSHALEHTLLDEVHHEFISLLVMRHLNQEQSGLLDTAISIFSGTHPKRFLSQLVSSQLDVDRLDYIRRDSFFTGVAEGVIGSERIIKMLQVDADLNLVVEEKAIFSLEKYLMSRRLMYWQVYFHKTVVVAEHMLVQLLKRAKYLYQKGLLSYANSDLECFLKQSITQKEFEGNTSLQEAFFNLDDTVIWAHMNVWRKDPDFVLSYLCQAVLDRKLLKIRLGTEPIDALDFETHHKAVKEAFQLSDEEVNYLVFKGQVSNHAYQNSKKDRIHILMKNGTTMDLKTASVQLESAILSKNMVKYFICFPVV